jgi:hypothetical protein
MTELPRRTPSAQPATVRPPARRGPPGSDRPILTRLVQAFLAGAAGGAFTAVAVIAANVGGLRDLMFGPNGDWPAGLLLIWGMVGLFGFVALGAAIMGLGDWSDRIPPGGPTPLPPGSED